LECLHFTTTLSTQKSTETRDSRETLDAVVDAATRVVHLSLHLKKKRFQKVKSHAL